MFFTLFGLTALRRCERVNANYALTPLLSQRLLSLRCVSSSHKNFFLWEPCFDDTYAKYIRKAPIYYLILSNALSNADNRSLMFSVPIERRIVLGLIPQFASSSSES